MATTKRSTDASRPRLGSSHAGTKKTAKATKPAPAAKRTATKGAAAKPAGKPKRSTKPAAGKPTTTRSTKPVAKKGARPSSRISSSEGPRSKRTTESTATDETRALALAVAGAGLEKKALNVQILDVSGRVDYADFLVLMSGRSDRHVLSIADSIEDALVKLVPKRKPSSVEGRTIGEWVVLDFGDLVAHVFQEETRGLYDLDSLWGDARRVPLSAGAGADA